MGRESGAFRRVFCSMILYQCSTREWSMKKWGSSSENKKFRQFRVPTPRFRDCSHKVIIGAPSFFFYFFSFARAAGGANSSLDRTGLHTDHHHQLQQHKTSAKEKPARNRNKKNKTEVTSDSAVHRGREWVVLPRFSAERTLPSFCFTTAKLSVGST